MKVQLTAPYTDEFGREYPSGCIVEFDQPTRERLIAQGKAIEMPEGTKGSISGVSMTACAVPNGPSGAAALEGKKNNSNK